LIKGGGGNTDIPNNVTNSDYSLSTGISGNGSNKTVDIDITANQAGQSTGSACTMMLCPKEAANTIYQMFWSDEANYEEAYCLGNADKKAFVHAGTYLEETMNTNSRRGLWGINATGSYMMTYRNGRTRRPFPVLTFAPISTSGKYRALGRPGGSFESDGGIGGYFLGEGLTSAELWTLYKTMKTFYTNIGRPMEAEGEKNSLRAYGDSMTAGAGSTSNANGWPTQYFAVDTNRMIGNFGVSGETASQIKDRLILDPSLETDTIVIMAGTNDYQGGASAVTNALTHISTMVAAVSSTGNPKWVVCTPPGSWLDTNVTVNYTYLISLCNGIASAYPNNYVDVRAAIIAAYNSGVPQDVTDHSNDVTPSTLQAPGDTPHLNDAGYAVVASTIKSFIDGKGW
jgi:lysophospholipase L1-like esterase